MNNIFNQNRPMGAQYAMQQAPQMTQPLKPEEIARLRNRGGQFNIRLTQDEVLIAARHLVDGCAAQQPDRPCVLNWHGLLLADHHLLIADGCRIESLGVGRLARQPVLARSTALSDLAAAGTLPQHCAPVRRTLLPFEVQALGSARDQGRGPIAA